VHKAWQWQCHSELANRAQLAIAAALDSFEALRRYTVSSSRPQWFRWSWRFTKFSLLLGLLAYLSARFGVAGAPARSRLRAAWRSAAAG